MLNRIVLMGRLTRDPELRQTPNGIAVSSFSLACERDFRAQGEEQKQSDFFDIVAWRHTADFTAKWFRKGQLVAVSGRLQTRKWTDKDGNNRTSVEIVADDAYFAERRSDSPGGSTYEMPPHPAEYAAPPAAAPSAPSPMSAASTFAELEDDDGDLPF